MPGLAFKGKTEGIEALRNGIAAINEELGTSYSVSFCSLNAAHFGVPQLRERVFVVGARDGRSFRFPAPTHAAPGDTELLEDKQPFRTTWDAFAGLSEPEDLEALQLGGKWADLLPSIPEGENYLWHTERGGGVPLFGWRRRYWNFLLKLAKDKPSWTIQAQPGPATGPFHWDNRRLSAKELCRLQTFPDGLKFNGRIADTQRLVGNAVASALAEGLAGAEPAASPGKPIYGGRPAGSGNAMPKCWLAKSAFSFSGAGGRQSPSLCSQHRTPRKLFPADQPESRRSICTLSAAIPRIQERASAERRSTVKRRKPDLSGWYSSLVQQKNDMKRWPVSFVFAAHEAQRRARVSSTSA